jgi:DNA-binding response OmpR family regulator
LRAQGVATPVLFLAARDGAQQRTAARDADFLYKPFAVAELLVRVGGLTRSRGASPPHAGDATQLDRPAREIVARGVRIDLTPTEFRLLDLLWSRQGEVVSRSDLVAAGWPAGAQVRSNTLDAYLARIRRKLRDVGAGETIRTVRAVGYRLR